MAEAFKRADPTGWIAKQLIGAGTATHLPVRVDKVACSHTGTANAGLLSWQNPEDVGVLAAVILNVTTAGTGTAGVDIGVGTSGGSADNLIDLGLINTARAISGFGTGGGANGAAWRIMSAKGGTTDYVVGKALEVDGSAVSNAYIIYIPIS